MSVATLCNRVYTIERKTIAPDAIGSPVDTYTDHLRIGLRVQPLSGAERIRHSKPDAEITHKVYAPGTPDIQHGDRIRVGNRFIYVHAVRNIDEQDRFLTIECMETAT